jgi:hypothetical protein
MAMPLDYARAVQLFMGTEPELAKALGLSAGDLRMLRSNPQRATEEQLARLAHVLVERGNGMVRVGEMLLEDHEG